jgi:hypothetical protein
MSEKKFAKELREILNDFFAGFVGLIKISIEWNSKAITKNCRCFYALTDKRRQQNK